MEFFTYFFILGCLMSTTACSSARIPSLVSSTENFHCSIVAFWSLNHFLISVLFSFSIFPIFFSAIAKTSIRRISNRCWIYRYNLKRLINSLEDSITMKIIRGGRVRDAIESLFKDAAVKRIMFCHFRNN